MGYPHDGTHIVEVQCLFGETPGQLLRWSSRTSPRFPSTYVGSCSAWIHQLGGRFRREFQEHASAILQTYYQGLIAVGLVSKIEIDMRERRANTEATDDSRESKSSNGLGPNPNQVLGAAVEEQFELLSGSESVLDENSVRASGAHELSGSRDRAKPLPHSRALPPRPGNFPPIPKVDSWSRSTKEQPKPARVEVSPNKVQGFRSEPPGGSTRAYKHAELEQLLNAADSIPSSLPPSPGNMAETVQLEAKTPDDGVQPGPMASWPQPVESLFPQLRDMAHNEEATTAYLKMGPTGLLDETVSLEDRQCWAAVAPSESAADISPNEVPAEYPAEPASAADSRLMAGLAALSRYKMARRRLARLQKRAHVRRVRLVRAIGLLGCLGLCAMIGVASPLGEQSGAQAVLHRTAARLSTWLGLPSASAGSRLVQLDIAAEPPQAQLLLDGREASNPLRLAYPGDTNSHEVTASAPGYRTRTLRMAFNRDVTVILGLSPDPAEPKLTPQ